MRLSQERICTGVLVALLGLLLGGCDDVRFTADLATDAPADPDIISVEANVLGLEFRMDDGSNARLEFRNGELIDLLDLQDGDPLRLFTDEELPLGRYTGARLLFDDDQDDNAVTTFDNREFTLLLAEGEFAAVDFLVEDEGRDRETLTLMLDLRQSLRFDESTDEYTLTPRLRAVPTEDAARVEGSVNVACPADTSLATGGAVYLFSGADVEPDDLDPIEAEPLATTSVTDPGFGGFQYALRFLPAGDYTISVTCTGNEDVLDVDDDLEFTSVGDVQLDAGEVLQLDLG
jgi:hypothetical protein